MGASDENAVAELEHVKAAGLTWARLEDQLGWYDSKSTAAQRAYKRLKVAELISASAIPVFASVSIPLTAVLGAVVVVLEGVQHLSQWHEHWILYRSTAEALKHERYLFLAKAGPYSDEDLTQVLAERVEALISREHSKWTEIRKKPQAKGHSS